MSEVLRTYDGPVRSTSADKGFRPGGRRKARTALLGAALLGLLYGCWTTRDNYPAARLIPDGQKCSLLLADLRATSQDRWPDVAPMLAAVAQLSGVMGGENGFAIPQALSIGRTAPDWLLNNLIGRSTYVTGNDIRRFEDAVVVTKMSRIGALLERFHRFVPGIKRDAAGGLQLRTIVTSGLHYAVRGRLLVVSPSRNALIRCLTLRSDETIRPDTFASIFGEPGVEDARGSVVFDLDDPGGRVLQSVSFAFRTIPEALTLKLHAVPRPEWKTRLRPVLDGLSPQPLPAPPDGMIMVSANFGRSLRELWTCLAGAVPGIPAGKWEEWERWPETGRPGLSYMLTHLLGPSGPGIRLSVPTSDINEIFPVPAIVGVFDMERSVADSLLRSFPSEPANFSPWEALPRFDGEKNQLRLSVIGGPSMEITAALHDNGLLVSSSRTLADDTLARAFPGAASERGNLSMHVRPLPCAQAVVDAGRLLVAQDLLRGYTVDSFEEAAAVWLDQASKIDEMRVLLEIVEGTIMGELTLTQRAAQ